MCVETFVGAPVFGDGDGFGNPIDTQATRTIGGDVGEVSPMACHLHQLAIARIDALEELKL